MSCEHHRRALDDIGLTVNLSTHFMGPGYPYGTTTLRPLHLVKFHLPYAGTHRYGMVWYTHSRPLYRGGGAARGQ